MRKLDALELDYQATLEAGRQAEERRKLQAATPQPRWLDEEDETPISTGSDDANNDDSNEDNVEGVAHENANHAYSNMEEGIQEQEKDEVGFGDFESYEQLGNEDAGNTDIDN